jgi:hypothetical protein
LAIECLFVGAAGLEEQTPPRQADPHGNIAIVADEIKDKASPSPSSIAPPLQRRVRAAVSSGQHLERRPRRVHPAKNILFKLYLLNTIG